jgi:hypothetical protein
MEYKYMKKPVMDLSMKIQKKDSMKKKKKGEWDTT